MRSGNKTSLAMHYDEIINGYPENLKDLFEKIICGIVKFDDDGYLCCDSLDVSFLCYLEIDKEKYKLSDDSASKLYVYGVWQYVSNHDVVWSHKIFSISYHICPKRESLYHYIRGCLSSEAEKVPLKDVVQFFASSKKIITKKDCKKNNLIWFLLAYICADLSLDEIKKQKITNFSCSDINYAPTNPLITGVVNSFYNYDFIPFFKEKSKFYDHYGNCSPFYELLLVLVGLCQEKKKELRRSLSEFVRNKDYSKLVEFLETISKSRRLNDEEQCLLSVGRELVRLLNSSNQPMSPSIISKSFVVKRQSFGFHTIKKIIEENDFVYAYDSYERFCADNNINTNENVLYLMLRDLNDLIASRDKDEKVSSADSSDLVVIALEIKASGNDFDEICKSNSIPLSDKLKVKLFLAREYYQDALELYYLSRDMNGYLPAVYWFRKYWDIANKLYVEVETFLSEYSGDYEDVRNLLNELRRLPESFDILENEGDKLRLMLK